MKIKNIEIYNIYSNSIIIIVTTDQDLEGIGQFIGFSIKSQINFLEQNIKPILIHRSPLEVEELWNEMYWRCHGKNGWLQVIAAIDIALHDILCKFKNIPLWKKLGAQAASPINLYWSMGHGHKKTNSEMLELIEKGQGLGVKSFKILPFGIAMIIFFSGFLLFIFRI